MFLLFLCSQLYYIDVHCCYDYLLPLFTKQMIIIWFRSLSCYFIMVTFKPHVNVLLLLHLIFTNNHMHYTCITIVIFQLRKIQCCGAVYSTQANFVANGIYQPWAGDEAGNQPVLYWVHHSKHPKKKHADLDNSWIIYHFPHNDC